MLPISPIPLPSTYTDPEGILPAIAALSLFKASTSPLSRINEFFSGTLHSVASLVCSFNIRYSPRSEEHTSELQSRFALVCRPLLEKTKHMTLKTLEPRPPQRPST